MVSITSTVTCTYFMMFGYLQKNISITDLMGFAILSGLLDILKLFIVEK